MSPLKRLSSEQLLTRLFELVQCSRKLEADLLEHLAEVDARRLYLREGCSSMFAYCVQVLRFAEAVAYKRIAAARAARRYPELLTALRSGDLHLTAVSLLAPQLTAKNVSELLGTARHRTADEIRRMLADRQPKLDVLSSLRRLPGSPARRLAPVDYVPSSHPTRLAGAAASSSRPPEPLGDERYLIRFTADRELHTQIQELKSLMRHQIPDGDVAKIVAQALHALLDQARKRKRGASSPARCPQTSAAPEPAPSTAAGRSEAVAKRPTRNIPTAIRRSVWERDEGRCGYESREGRRCGTRDFLEFHHQVPWVRCREHRASNIHLRCRAHNQHAAELDFGAPVMAGYRKFTSAIASGESVAQRASPSDPELDSNPVGLAVETEWDGLTM